MKNHKSILHLGTYLLLGLFLFSSCQESKYDNTQLHGTWKVSEWEVLSSGDKRSNQMDMTFKADGSYVVDYGSEKENGKYWISKENLHTVETNAAEKTVKIMVLSGDSLQIQMNRAGELENVLLRKSK